MMRSPSVALITLAVVTIACSGDLEGDGAGGAGGATSGAPTTSGNAPTGSGGEGATASNGATAGTTTGGGGAPTTGSGSGAGATTGTSDVTTGATTGSGETTSTGDPATSSASGGPFCGDATCDAGETCESCASDCGGCDVCEGASDATTALDAEELAFFTLINDYRAENGRGPVAPCTSLSRAAQGHSEDMRDQGYFSHDSQDGRDPWERACNSCYELGCGPQTQMAENIAAGNSGAAATFEQWRTSPGHNTNMLGSSFTVMGLGRATGGGPYGVYWTSVFGAGTEGSCN